MAIGDRARHPFWRGRVEGTAAYTADIDRAGLLHGALVRSPWPSAEIRSISTRAAFAIDGVEAVLTAADMPVHLYQDYGIMDRPILARGRVRHVGEQVAVVLAETEEAARRAVNGVRVRYRRTRPLLTKAETRAQKASVIHPAAPDNVAASVRREYGDVDAQRGPANRTVSGRYRYPRQAHACMEPSAVLAEFDSATGRLDLWTPTQAARNIQREIARLLDLETDRVRVHDVAIGGDFGSRVRASDIEAVAAVAAVRTGRPVRIQLSREEEFAQTKHRFDFEIDVTSAFVDNGTVTFRDSEVTVDCGAYAHAGGNELAQATGLLTAQYDVDAVRSTGEAVYTNTRPGGSFRGAGFPQAVFALESHVDEIAAEAGVDPAELRRSSFNRPGTTTPNGWEIDSLAFEECLDVVLDSLDWDNARRFGGSGRGVGIAAAIHVTGAVVSAGSSTASARVSLSTDESTTVSTGASDPGTGQALVAAQVTASELGVDTADVVVSSMDTARTPPDPGAGASRGTYTTGRAVQAAARLLAAELRNVAADKFGADPGDVRLEDGEARCGDDAVTLGDLVSLSPDAVEGIVARDATISAEIPVNPTPTGVGNLAPSYSCAVHGAEVDVDFGTGAVQVQRVVAAHDSGTIINPAQAEGQVVGGVVMGLGAALGEDLLLEGGQVVNPSFADYPMPRSADVPSIEVTFVGGPDARGPSGAKGLAEIALSPTAPAIANAVAHATGHRFRCLPLTPDVVLNRVRTSTDSSSGRRRIVKRPSRWWIAVIRWLYPLGLHRLLRITNALRQRASRNSRRSPQPAPVVQVVETVDEALPQLSADRRTRMMGGGTDLLPAQREGLVDSDKVLVLGARAARSGFDLSADGSLEIGATVTLGELEDYCSTSGLPGLAMVAELTGTIASPQLRNVATVAGNLLQDKRCWFYRHGFDCYKRAGTLAPCYAIEGDHRFFHAAMDGHRCQAVTPSDLASAFVALDAIAEVRREGAGRSIRLVDLYRGPAESVLQADEVITTINVPPAGLRRVAAAEKLALVTGGFALTSAIVAAELSDGTLTSPRVVLGGVAPTPVRVVEVERALDGVAIERLDAAAVAASWEWNAHPLRNNAWKVTATTSLITRAIERVLVGPGPADQ